MSSAKNLYLCVLLLNKYLYYYTYESNFLFADDINNLMDFIKEHIDGLEDRESAKDGLKFFEATQRAIKVKAETNPRFKQIKINI